MRNIFESLSQNASAEQQQMLLHKKPSKWDRPDGQKRADIVRADETQEVLSEERSYHGTSDANGADREPVHRETVHGSSTVFVLEDELPPPAFTKNIVAKFREMEAEQTAASPDKTASTSWRSSRSGRSENRGLRSPAQQSPPRGGEEDIGDWSQNGDERGRSDRRRTYGRERERSSSPRRAVVDELPQEGTARSLLARWRTIEQEAHRESEDTPRRSSAAAKRSQSTSRLEVRQRVRSAAPVVDDSDDQDSLQTTRYHNPPVTRRGWSQ